MNTNDLIDHHASIITRGVLGVLAPIGGTAVSLMAEIEIWLRVTSLVVGLIVGVLTIVTLVKRLRRWKD